MSRDTERNEIETLDELIEDFEIAMLVTHSLQGELRARPMLVAGHETGGALMFVSRADDEKLKEVLKAPRVAVTMQSDGHYLSISGTARLETDQVKLDELWSPRWRLWLPDNAEEAELCLIRVEPTNAEYWDRTGATRLEFIWRAGKALLQGAKVDDDEPVDHGKINLGKGDVPDRA